MTNKFYTRNAYYARLYLAAAILLLVANEMVPKGSWRLVANLFAIALLVAGLVLMYLIETGRSSWNGPKWGTVPLSSARASRRLIVVPALCAVAIPILILLNRRWGLSDAHIGFACGVLLGISLTVTVKLRSRSRAESSGTE